MTATFERYIFLCALVLENRAKNHRLQHQHIWPSTVTRLTQHTGIAYFRPPGIPEKGQFGAT